MYSDNRMFEIIENFLLALLYNEDSELKILCFSCVEKEEGLISSVRVPTLQELTLLCIQPGYVHFAQPVSVQYLFCKKWCN